MVIQSSSSVTDGTSTSAYRYMHMQQPPTLITMANVKGDMLPTLITGTIGPVLIYKIRQAPSDLQWTRCGLETVQRSSELCLCFPHWGDKLLLSCHEAD